MNLHRSTAPDWESIPAKQRSLLQHIAARTNGVVTPGNVMSLVGLVIVVIGLITISNDQLIPGLALVLLGRLADLLDGLIADKTSTKSPFGEAVDASIDKLAAAIALVIFAIAELLPIAAAAVIASQTLFGVVIFYMAQRRGGRVHPTAFGKIATALLWIVVVLWPVAQLSSQTIFTWSAAALTVIFTASAGISAAQYYKQYQALGRS